MESWSCFVHVFRCIPLSTQIWFIVHCSWFILFEGIHLVACFLFQSLLRRVVLRFFCSLVLSIMSWFVLAAISYIPRLPWGFNYPSPGRPASPMELVRVLLFQQLSVSPWEANRIVFPPEFDFFEAFFPPFVSGIVFGFSCQRSFSISVSSSQTFLSALDLFLLSPR